MTRVEDQDPPCDQLADDHDDLDWDRAKHGRMLAAATPGDTVTTEPYVYDRGGLLQPGYTLAYNGTGEPERIRTAEQEAEDDR